MGEVLSFKDTKLVGVNERGNRVGEDHPRATLTDHEVDLIRELAEGGMPQRMIAEKFEISRGTVSDIVTFRRRASYPVGFRRVKVVVAGHERFGTMSLARPEAVPVYDRPINLNAGVGDDLA